jgi:hypothetical protein
MKPMFQTQAESGMPDAEWAAYQAMQQEALEASVTDMTKASLRQIRWLSGARDRILRHAAQARPRLRKAVARGGRRAGSQAATLSIAPCRASADRDASLTQRRRRGKGRSDRIAAGMEGRARAVQ